ncbi:hypothetical protein [Paracoccus cavernae]|uniref:hypothetical protein n=1 Tax=Paracoccus cavernae TaxID=1571207 RepID=UPI0035F35EA6
MARGFAKGLFQGAILCVAAVAALSLVVPLPQKATDAGDAAGRTAVSGVATQSGDRAGSTGPDAEAISLPVGSEFARGDDVQPVAPAPLTRPENARQGEAPKVMTTPDAAASAPARITAGRPQTGVEAPVAPVAMAPVSEPSDLLPSPAREAPIPIEPPGRVQTPALDRRPEQVSTESRDGATSSRPDEPARNAASARDAGSPGQTGAANDDAPAIGAGDDRSPARAFVPQPPALIAQEGGAEESPRLDDLAALQAEQPPAGRPADAGVVAPEAAASVAVGVIRMDPLDLSLPPDLGGLGLSPER